MRDNLKSHTDLDSCDIKPALNVMCMPKLHDRMSSFELTRTQHLLVTHLSKWNELRVHFGQLSLTLRVRKPLQIDPTIRAVHLWHIESQVSQSVRKLVPCDSGNNSTQRNCRAKRPNGTQKLGIEWNRLRTERIISDEVDNQWITFRNQGIE